MKKLFTAALLMSVACAAQAADFANIQAMTASEVKKQEVLQAAAPGAFSDIRKEIKLKCTTQSPGSLFRTVQLEREFDRTARKVTWFISYTDAWGQAGRVQTQMNSTPVSVKYPLPSNPPVKMDLVVGFGAKPQVAILTYGTNDDGNLDAVVDFLGACVHNQLSPLN